jgi:hypothetical protein
MPRTEEEGDENERSGAGRFNVMRGGAVHGLRAVVLRANAARALLSTSHAEPELESSHDFDVGVEGSDWTTFSSTPSRPRPMELFAPKEKPSGG